MPEGDTIHAVARALAPRLIGEPVQRLVVLGQPIPLSDRTVTDVEARGKHLVVTLAGPVLRVHLGMKGSWHRYDPGQPWERPAGTAGVILETPQHVAVCFQPAEAELYLDRGGAERGILGKLGPDLLAATFDAEAALARARTRDGGAPIADLLLDQRVACGIGNVYKCEVLFLHGLAPRTPAARVSDAQLVACWATARALMQENLALGGPRTTTAAHFREADAKAPSAKALKALRRRIPAHLRSWVYEREGEPCLRCRGPIAREVLGRDLRVTYWCPRCQPLEGAETPAGSG
ncbi:MAG: Fpg/Nei family DNA glycosylase [Myxococcales bacterium]|nr:Fpg/Nei family DNA glycosylase [Myxococcales bacterium]MCB9732418.1 Fpg/Nei family DNA glycosylase [Deltaproteobacteria bacterium]